MLILGSNDHDTCNHTLHIYDLKGLSSVDAEYSLVCCIVTRDILDLSSALEDSFHIPGFLCDKDDDYDLYTIEAGQTIIGTYGESAEVAIHVNFFEDPVMVLRGAADLYSVYFLEESFFS